MSLFSVLAGSILLAEATDVQPIPPSQIVAAAKSAGQGAAQAGQMLAGSLAHIALLIAGLVLLVGVGLALARVTMKVLQLGVGIFIGVVVMYVLLVYPDQVIGTISGFLHSFFEHLKPEKAKPVSMLLDLVRFYA